MGYPQAVPPQQYPPAQYAPQQYAQPAPSAPQGMPPQGSPFIGAGGAGIVAPKPRNLVGSTVIITPHRIDESSQFQGQARPTLICDLIVVDTPHGGPVTYGENQDRDVSKQTPPSHRSAVPARFPGVWWNSAVIVDKIRNKMMPGQPVLILGVIEQGTQGNRPYMITDHDRMIDGSPRPDGQQRYERALQVWRAVEAGQFVNPTPEPLTPASQPAHVAQAMQYGQPTPQYQTPPQAYTPAPQQYGQPVPQGPPPAQPQGGYYAESAAPAQNLDQAPPNWDASVWANMPPAQRAQVLASQNGQPAPAQQYGQPPGPGI